MNFYQSLKKSQRDIIIPALSASFLLSTTLCFFGPATIYYTNIFEFFFTFSDIFPLLVSLTIVVGLLLTVAILRLFTGKIHRTIVCFVFSLGLLFYIQGNIFIWNYGLLDGHEIVWNNYIRIGIFELLVWIVILAIFIIKSEKIYRYVAVSCMILIVIQTIGLFSLVISAPSEPLWKNYNFIDNKSKFDFSDNSNVIVIVLDTLPVRHISGNY